MSSFSKLSIGLAMASTLALLAGCSEEKKPEAAEVLRPVKIAEISAADEGRALVYSGSVRARKQMDLGFRVAGKITERLVDVGERVTPGTVLDRLDAEDIVLFFDDDFFPHLTYIARIIEAFHDNPNILGVTGNVLADGAKGPGRSIEETDRRNKNAGTSSV